MKNKIWLKIFICIFFILFVSSTSQAFYKKKMVVGQFKNPADWDKPYQPGNIIAEFLAQELTHSKRVYLVSLPASMNGMMDNPDKAPEKHNIEPANFDSGKMKFPGIVTIQGPDFEMGKPTQKMEQMDNNRGERPLWPVGMGSDPKKASLTEIRGEVIKFIPDIKQENPSEADSMGRKNAGLQVHVELVQNKTGRILFEKTFTAFSNAGTQSFSVEKLSFGNGNAPLEFSSMNYALDYLTREIGSFIGDKLNSLMLEGEVISVNKKEMTPQMGQKTEFLEEVLINLGSVNGVRIGDTFKVHEMGLGLHDPFTGSDLGDIYVKTGVIQISYVWEGFSKAVPLGGKNFKSGFLVQSMTALGGGRYEFINGTFIKPEEEKVPWWDFHGITTAN